MVVLNVVVYATAGFLGLAFLLQTLHRLSVVQTTIAEPVAVEAMAPTSAMSEAADRSEEPIESISERMVPSLAGPLDRSADHVLGRHVRTVFRIWVIVFGLVGAQMAWVLRPFIGHPNTPFTWFRATGSNFFEGVLTSIRALLW